MRVVRRASVVFSLVLVVAIAVGYMGRRSEVAQVRDERLSRAAEVGAARVDALVEATTVAAMSANSTDAAVNAIRRTYPSVSACAGDTEGSVCQGPLSTELSDTNLVPDGLELSLTALEGAVLIAVDGDDVALRVISPIEVRTDERNDDMLLWATTIEPIQGVGRLVDTQGRVQTSAAVLAAPGTYVVAQTPSVIHLPAREERFYVVVSSLALLLLMLAGTTLIVEQRALRERATFDALTRLPNRSEFERRALEIIATADRAGRDVCLLLFDLNDFKLVNDTYGHNIGDELLRVVGRRLDRSVRDGDLVGRWGGDEFVVLMPGIGTEEMGVRRAREIAETVAGRTRIDGVPEALRVHASVGVAISSAHANDFDALLDAADDAMYRAKRDGSVTAIAAQRIEPSEPMAPPVPAR